MAETELLALEERLRALAERIRHERRSVWAGVALKRSEWVGRIESGWDLANNLRQIIEELVDRQGSGERDVATIASILAGMEEFLKEDNKLEAGDAVEYVVETRRKLDELRQKVFKNANVGRDYGGDGFGKRIRADAFGVSAKVEFKDPWLRAHSVEEERLRKKLREWMTSSTFPETVDRWIGQFRTDERKALALKVLLRIDYISESSIISDRIPELVDGVVKAMGEELTKVIVVVDEAREKSGNRFAYSIKKSFEERGMTVEVKSASQLGGGCSGVTLVAFDDTYGTGKQFMRRVWKAGLKCAAKSARCVVVGAVAIGKQAHEKFQELKADGARLAVFPKEAAENVYGGGFSESELRALEEQGKEICPKHPFGYGNMGLLVAYESQCPNNSLPMIWADGRNRDREVCGHQAVPWVALFRYRKNPRNATAVE